MTHSFSGLNGLKDCILSLDGDTRAVMEYTGRYHEPVLLTTEDNACLNAIELERYEDTVPLTPYELRLLRRRIISGHSAHDNPGSRYICPAGHHPVG